MQRERELGREGGRGWTRRQYQQARGYIKCCSREGDEEPHVNKRRIKKEKTEKGRQDDTRGRRYDTRTKWMDGYIKKVGKREGE